MSTWLSLMDRLNATGRFTRLLTAVEQAALHDTLMHRGPLTLLAPNDDAFRLLSEATQAALFSDPELLAANLNAHILNQNLTAAQLVQKGTLETMHGRKVTARFDQNRVKVNNAVVLEPDAITSNGILHEIDTVLLAVALPEAKPANLLPVETWIPYQPGEALPIGDAELVAGDVLVRRGVEQLAGILEHSKAKINIARAVRLSEHGETTYRIPCSPSDHRAAMLFARQESVEYVMGMIIVEGTTKLPSGPGAYAERLYRKDETWYIGLVNAAGETVFESTAVVRGDERNYTIPVAAIHYGSKTCWHRVADIRICERCYWYEELGLWAERCGDEA